MEKHSQSLGPIASPVSMEKFAYAAIKEAILNFRFPPGESLVEATLAAQLKTSKTPVRDALTQLVREGFIEKVPYKGYYVAEISRQKMIELFEIRSVLEGMVTRHAVERMTPQQCDKAQALVQAHSQASAEKNTILASEINHQFHQLLIESGGSDRIASMLTNLDEHLQRYRVLSNISAGRLEKSAAEHAEILKAIQAHDAAAAEAAARHHLLSVSADLAKQDFDQLIREISASNSYGR